MIALLLLAIALVACGRVLDAIAASAVHDCAVAWRQDEISELADVHCDVDRIDWNHGLGAAAFFYDYVKRERPVMIRGIATEWPAFTRWSRSYVEARLGVQTLRSGTPREAAVSGQPQDKIPLPAVLDATD